MSYEGNDPINIINSIGISNTNFDGLKNEDLIKAGISGANDMQKKDEQRIKEAGQKTLDRWNAIKALTDPNNEYGLVVTSLVRPGSTDHSQGMAIDISTTKAKKYLFRYFVEKLVPLLLQIKWAQQFRSYSADWKKSQQYGVYKIFLSLHNYHIHISTNPNRGNALGFETWNGGDKSSSSSYTIIPYTWQNTLKAMEWYDVTVSEVITDNSVEVAIDSVKGISNSVVDKTTESTKSFLASISIFAFIILIFGFIIGGKKNG